MKTILSVLGAAACALLLTSPVTAANRAAASPRNILGPAETISAKVVEVLPKQKLLIVQDSKGTDYDIQVMRATRIRFGTRPMLLQDLTKDTNAPVEVKFVPERRGDIARLIELMS